MEIYYINPSLFPITHRTWSKRMKRFWGIFYIVVDVGAFTAAIIVTVALGFNPDDPQKGALIAVVASLLYCLMLLARRIHEFHTRRSSSKRTIQRILNLARLYIAAKPNATSRVYLCLPRNDHITWFVEDAAAQLSTVERTMKFSHGLGFIGQTWVTREITLLNLSDYDSADRPREYLESLLYTPSQAKVIAERERSYMAVPILGDDNKTIGILVVDVLNDVHEAGLDTQGLQDRARYVARDISDLIVNLTRHNLN